LSTSSAAAGAVIDAVAEMIGIGDSSSVVIGPSAATLTDLTLGV
jgi:hypothetical protein